MINWIMLKDSAKEIISSQDTLTRYNINPDHSFDLEVQNIIVVALHF